MDRAELTLLVLNLVLGLGFALPLAGHLRKMAGSDHKMLIFFLCVIGLYSAESVFLVLGMGIPICGLGLAFLWGTALGLWLRGRSKEISAVVKTSLFVAFYSSLPAFSFIVIPLLALLSRQPVLSTEYGLRYGLPDFLPWPMNTILGFYVIIATGALFLKTAITAGVATFLFQHRKLVA
jgi:hypothetical protein